MHVTHALVNTCQNNYDRELEGQPVSFTLGYLQTLRHQVLQDRGLEHGRDADGSMHGGHDQLRQGSVGNFCTGSRPSSGAVGGMLLVSCSCRCTVTLQSFGVVLFCVYLHVNCFRGQHAIGLHRASRYQCLPCRLLLFLLLPACVLVAASLLCVCRKFTGLSKTRQLGMACDYWYLSMAAALQRAKSDVITHSKQALSPAYFLFYTSVSVPLRSSN